MFLKLTLYIGRSNTHLELSECLSVAVRKLYRVGVICFLFVFAALEFELKASCLLGCSYCLSHSPILRLGNL
jgi:hypothetical protein